MALKPNCGKCGSEKFARKFKAFGGEMGVLVYCGGCGAILSWAPQAK